MGKVSGRYRLWLLMDCYLEKAGSVSKSSLGLWIYKWLLLLRKSLSSFNWYSSWRPTKNWMHLRFNSYHFTVRLQKFALHKLPSTISKFGIYKMKICTYHSIVTENHCCGNLISYWFVSECISRHGFSPIKPNTVFKITYRLLVPSKCCPLTWVNILIEGVPCLGICRRGMEAWILSGWNNLPPRQGACPSYQLVGKE